MYPRLVDLTQPSEGAMVADLQQPSTEMIYGCIMSAFYINNTKRTNCAREVLVRRSSSTTVIGWL